MGLTLSLKNENLCMRIKWLHSKSHFICENPNTRISEYSGSFSSIKKLWLEICLKSGSACKIQNYIAMKNAGILPLSKMMFRDRISSPFIGWELRRNLLLNFFVLKHLAAINIGADSLCSTDFDWPINRYMIGGASEHCYL